MSSICYSSASLLRCDLLSTNESIGLVIPVIIQAILTSTLTALLWARSRRHLFLACEGWIDLLLSLLNLFWELYPAVRRSPHAFKSLDIVIGSMSFIPILFYSLFLCSLILTDFITILPPSVRRVVRPFLIFFIPVLIGMHEAASFIGISYTLSPTDQSMITFQINRDKDLWTFFTSSTLALFAGFQAIVSCLAIIRVVQALIQRRRLEHRYSDNPLHGLGWLNSGIQFGVVETVIGFAAVACFGTHLARRIIRLFSRALLCIGVFIDSHDRDDSMASTGKPVVIPYRQSRLKPFISNPRFSTFQRLSPTASAFHPKPLAPPMLVATSDPDLVSSKDQFNGAPGRQRVKILFDQGAPQLEVRLSHFELPYPPQPAPTTSTESPTRSYSPLPDFVPRPFARPYGSQTDSMASSLSKVEIVTVPRMLFVPELAKATVMRTPSGRTVDRSVPSRPTSRPTSQHSVSSPRELLSLEETKGKRVMSGEQNEEFFQVLMSAGVRSFTGHQTGEVEEDTNIFTVPSGDSLPSLALSFSDDATTQEDHRSSMEEYYTEPVRSSQEQLDVQQETPQSSSHGSGHHQLSLPPSVRSARGNEKDNNSNRVSAPPPRPPRNPSRASISRQGSPDSSSLLAPNAVTGDFASQIRRWEELPSNREEMEKRQPPSMHIKAALHTSKPSLTAEPVSPAKTDSDSAYSRETYERQSWASQASINSDQVAIAL